MKPFVLRSEKGGYDKKEVLNMLDAYNVLKFQVEEGNMMRGEAENEIARIRQMPLNKVPVKKFFSPVGFKPEEVEEYFNELEQEIMNAVYQG